MGSLTPQTTPQDTIQLQKNHNRFQDMTACHIRPSGPGWGKGMRWLVVLQKKYNATSCELQRKRYRQVVEEQYPKQGRGYSLTEEGELFCKGLQKIVHFQYTDDGLDNFFKEVAQYQRRYRAAEDRREKDVYKKELRQRGYHIREDGTLIHQRTQEDVQVEHFLSHRNEDKNV